MKYGYARVSTDGQSVEAQVRQLTKAGCKKVFREVSSGAKTDRAQLRRLLDQLAPGDVLTVTRLDRLARSTRDLLNTFAAITAKKAGFRSHLWTEFILHITVFMIRAYFAKNVMANWESMTTMY
jgi:DNA invertase Pin-like site-specific DNA recombinase